MESASDASSEVGAAPTGWRVLRESRPGPSGEITETYFTTRSGKKLGSLKEVLNYLQVHAAAGAGRGCLLPVARTRAIHAHL